MSVVFLVSKPVKGFPQGVILGVLAILGVLWIVIGSTMIKRYCFLVQRGLTEKEKVSRRRGRRAGRRRYGSPEDL